MREEGVAGGDRPAESDGSGGGVDPATASDAAFGEGEEPRTDEQGRILDGAAYEDVPTWDDEYLDRVSDRLIFNYDLERDHRVRGEAFDLAGLMRIESQKQFFHPSLGYADHHSDEYLFARRQSSVTVRELERLVEFGHALADERVEGDEEHYGTDLSFVLVVPEIPEDVRRYVVDFRERQLLKYGYFGHYEINLGVVAPEREVAVASREADVVSAFALWDDVPERHTTRGLLTRLVGTIREKLLG
ncbi:hypothetical protein [Halobaculum gomorrense]|uniref:DUF8052 domain-containing protein n=1 Tax=Halobaculum gomorrense TaxID=43928 RepID=A0A1M5QEM3_9EURY|nr:hypothetical protein [Halobaculum gomorrense]SHH12199.1 hypothetical protein SAMN05443636_1858 [Halobaculum gomorrense]